MSENLQSEVVALKVGLGMNVKLESQNKKLKKDLATSEVRIVAAAVKR